MKEVGFIDDFVWLANYTLAGKRCALSRDDRLGLLTWNLWTLFLLALLAVAHTVLEYFEHARVFEARYAVSVALFAVLLASLGLFDECKHDSSLRLRLARPEQLEPVRLAVCLGLLVGCLGLQVGLWFVYEAVVGVAWPEADPWRECLVRGVVGGSAVLLLQSLFELYVQAEDEWSEYLKTLNGMASMLVYHVYFVLVKRKVYAQHEDCSSCLLRDTRYYLYGYMALVFGGRTLARLLAVAVRRLRQRCSLRPGRSACSSVRGSKLPILEYVQLDFARETLDRASPLRWAILNTCYAVCNSHVTSTIVFACLASALFDLLCYEVEARLLHRDRFDGCHIHIRKYLHLHLTCLVLGVGCVLMFDDVQDSVYYYLYLLLVFVCVLLMRKFLVADRCEPSDRPAVQTGVPDLPRSQPSACAEESQGLLEDEKTKQRPTSSEELGTGTAETPGREAKEREVSEKFAEDMLEERRRYERLLLKYNQRIEVGAMKDRDGRVLFEMIEGLIVSRRLKKVSQLVPRVICEASDHRLSDYYYPQFDVYLAHDEWLDYAVKHEIDGLDKLVLSREEPRLEQGIDFADFMVVKSDEEYRKVFEVYMKKHKLRDMMDDYLRRRGDAWMQQKRLELTVWIKLERSDMSVEHTDKIFDCLELLYHKFTTYEIGPEEVAQLVRSLMQLHRDEQLLMVNRMYYAKWCRPRGVDKTDFCQTVRSISSDNVERQLLILLGLADLGDSGSVSLAALRGLFELSGVKDFMQRRSVEGVLGELFGGEDALPAKELLARSLESADMKAMCSTLFK